MTSQQNHNSALPFDVEQMKVDVLALLKSASETIIMPRWKALDAKDIATKTSETDLVTIADSEAELFLTPQLEVLLKRSFALGEEACSENRTLKARAEDEWVWTIDPVDGTKNFVKGSDLFCSMVALSHFGRPVMAWIYRPVEKDCLTAISGNGVYHITSKGHSVRRQRRKTGTDINEMSGSLNAMGFDLPRRDIVRQRLKQLPGRTYIGCAGVETANIALGNADYLMHSKLTPWDNSPVDLICREAGSVAYLAPEKENFTTGSDGILLVAPDDATWDRLAHYIWDK